MPSISVRILDRVEAALAPTAGVLEVYRERWEPLARDECPAIVIRPSDETDEIPTVGPIVTEQEFEVHIHSSSTSGLSTAVDAIRVDAHARLMAEPWTGLQVIHCYPMSRAWRVESGDVGILECRYRVAYRTRLADLTQ